jgi:acyl-CoA reductase-like NAD-dependent aldehyde dehydrogenase
MRTRHFTVWLRAPLRKRSKIIARSAQALLKKKEELARFATLEMGKRIAESRDKVLFRNGHSQAREKRRSAALLHVSPR